MDIQPTNQQSISDDQELAKVLAGVNGQVDDTTQQTQDQPAPVMPEPVAAPAVDEPVADEQPADVAPAIVEPSLNIAGSDDLSSIKNDALQELRPLVDKLDASAEEKFDTYLLLLRSTDDRTLIAPAHDAAKNITDEARRAQALLDIIKEIDFLSQPQQ